MSKQITKMLLPRMKKYIREEMEKGFAEILLEIEEMTSNIVVESSKNTVPINNNIETIKRKIALSKSKASKSMRNIENGEWTVDDLIESAKPIPQEDQIALEEALGENKQIIPAEQADNVVDPSMIDYSSILKKLG